MPPPPSFKRALITGASGGLGKALKELFQSRGVKVVDASRSSKECPTNLLEKRDRQKLCTLIGEFKPDLIINNAGMGLYGPALSHEIEEQLKMVKLNTTALTEITLSGAKMLLENGKKGTILNISSIAAFFPYPTHCLYGATKAFVNSFSQALDSELQTSGIRVLCTCPGQIQTDFRVRASKGDSTEVNKKAHTPEQAALLIWEQIEKGETLSILGWKNKMMVYIAKLLPRSLVDRFLIRGIKKRYTE